MKSIKFKLNTSQRIYSDYIKRIRRMVADLSKTDQEEILMEFNSHIYESTIESKEDVEVEQLVTVLEKLGSPEEVLIPLVAEKKLDQATKTFNPVHVFKAIVMNIGNGIAYIVFGLLYLFLGTFIFCIFAKLANPSKVGIFYKEGEYLNIGLIEPDLVKAGQTNEILGFWFIPIMIVVSILWYLLITLLLRWFKKGQ